MVETIYEWVVEEISADGSGDIVDCHYWPEDQLTNAIACFRAIRTSGAAADFGLCRRVCDNEKGDLERGYAYRVDGVWEASFEYGARIPKRFKLAAIEGLD